MLAGIGTALTDVRSFVVQDAERLSVEIGCLRGTLALHTHSLSPPAAYLNPNEPLHTIVTERTLKRDNEELWPIFYYVNIECAVTGTCLPLMFSPSKSRDLPAIAQCYHGPLIGGYWTECSALLDHE